MKEEYTLKDGKLILHKSGGLSWPVKALLIICALVLAGAGGYTWAWKKLSLPENSHVISVSEYTRYQDMESAFNKTLEQNIKRKDYILDHDKLRLVFSEIFPKVRMDDKTLDAYIQAVSKWGAEYSIPPLLLLSIIWRESFFDASIVSSANARGPMQVIYKYHTEKLKKAGKGEMDLHEIDTGVRVGAEIMREYFDRFDQDIFRTMKAYVGGSHKTYAQDILTRYFRARMYVEERYGKL